MTGCRTDSLSESVRTPADGRLRSVVAVLLEHQAVGLIRDWLLFVERCQRTMLLPGLLAHAVRASLTHSLTRLLLHTLACVTCISCVSESKELFYISVVCSLPSQINHNAADSTAAATHTATGTSARRGGLMIATALLPLSDEVAS